jgi:serine/threonine protein phosphatase 1
LSRRFAITDIHGCRATFEAILREINLQRMDTLYLLGDYIDRGPDGKGVLDLMLNLSRDGYDLQPLRGNHEQLLLDALDDQEAFKVWKGNGGYATLKEFGVDHPKHLSKRYLDFLKSLELMHLLNDYVLVHAGLDFRKNDPIHETAQADLLWARDFRCDPSALSGRTLVTGHTLACLSEIHQSLTTHHIKIDNGCYSKGHLGFGALVALDLDTRAIVVVKNRD